MAGSVLRTSTGRLRYAWSATMFLMGTAGAVGLARQLPLHDKFGLEYSIILLLVLSWAMMSIVERRPFAMLGLSWTIFSARQIWVGLFIGGVTVSIAVIAAVMMGAAELAPGNLEGWKIASTLGAQLVTVTIAAALEELLFRGFLFQTALDRAPVSLVMGVFAVLFGAVHIGNDNVSALGVINTVLAGLWLGGAFLRTRQLWLPIAIHAAWNFVQGPVWGIEISGHPVAHAMIRTRLVGPDWLCGGAYGIEGGVLCTAVVMIGIVLVHTMRAVHISPDQFALIHRVRYAEDLAIDDPRSAHV